MEEEGGDDEEAASPPQLGRQEPEEHREGDAGDAHCRPLLALRVTMQA